MAAPAKIGLRAKLFWLVILLIASLSAVLTAISLHEQRASMEQDLQGLGTAAIKNLAQDSELGLFAENSSFITPIFSALKGERSFLYAIVYRPNHEVLGLATADDHATDLYRKMTERPDVEELKNSSEPVARKGEVDGHRLIEWWAPVYGASRQADESIILDAPPGKAGSSETGEVIGIVRLGLSLEGIEETLRGTLKTALATLAAFLSATLVITYIVATTVTRPLAKLVRVSEAVARGDLEQHVSIRSNDEVGMLAEAFNRMIGAIKERDAQLRKAHDELEARVQQRTAELLLTNTKLNEEIQERTRAESELENTARELERRANELEKSNKELDQFAYIAAHDLKAPLRAIANLATWIEEDLDEHLSGEARAHMSTLKGRVQRLENLINGILQYSRLGRVTNIEIAAVDTREMVKQIVDMLGPPSTFAIELGDTLPVLKCAHTLLEQVFMNLIGNAIKYHHREDGRIRISSAQKGAYVEFTVADDGPGIAPRFHEKVFTIFQTLHARDTIESTGIGLAIVKRIVEAQGGTVTLESDEGQGATFRFTWPTEPLGER